MTIVYLTSTSFADTDFPLIKQYQEMGHKVFCFMLVPCFQLRSTLINIKKQIASSGIFPASAYEELQVYSEYLDFSSFYVINRTEASAFAKSTLMLTVQLNASLKRINPDIIHTTRCFDLNEWPLYKWRKKTILTIHDPFPHSGEDKIRSRIVRHIATRLIKRFVILNSIQLDGFVKYFHLDKSQVLLNKIGKFDYLDYINNNVESKSKYKYKILFFGRISKYKGIEYLCEAVKQIHEIMPDVCLTIAGGGTFYFDISEYLKKNYVTIINRYVEMKELITLVDNSTICVCPYTDATQSGVVTMAYSLGKPVIATCIGGLREMVIDGETGLLVQPKNVAALSEAIVRLLKDRNLYYKMQCHIIDNYFVNDRDWRVIAEKYIDFYNSK